MACTRAKTPRTGCHFGMGRIASESRKTPSVCRNPVFAQVDVVEMLLQQTYSMLCVSSCLCERADANVAQKFHAIIR